MGGLGSSGAGASAASADAKQAFAILLLAACDEQQFQLLYLTTLCLPYWEANGFTMLTLTGSLSSLSIVTQSCQTCLGWFLPSAGTSESAAGAASSAAGAAVIEC